MILDHELRAYVSYLQMLIHLSHFVTLMKVVPDVQMKVKKTVYLL